MTIAKSESVLARFPRVPNSRAALALAHVASDSRIWERLFPSGPSRLGGAVADNYFDTLLKQPGCENAWETYTNTTTGFPEQLARGTASLNGFRHYSIQDSMYLEDYVRVRLAAVATASVDDIREFVDTVKPGLDYAIYLRDACEKKLGVPLKEIKNEPRSERLETSIKYYMEVVSAASAKPWIDIHFALLPCIKGYYNIATDLLKDPKIVKNTLYYTMWIEANADPSFATRYDEILQEATKNATSEDWKRWGIIFKTTCVNEGNFFKLATEDYKKLSPYHILEEGDYTIRPYSDKNHFLGVDGDNVVITTTPAKWEFKNAAEGYIINIKDSSERFLGLPAQSASPPYYDIQIMSTPQTWSINTVYDYGGEAVQGYQLFAPGKLAFVLDWDDADSKVFAANNYQGVSQTWVLTKA